MPIAIESQPGNAVTPVTPVTALDSRGRVASVDALRGFDMFWIIGADALVHALNRMNGGGFLKFIVDQLEHKEWRGFAFYDMIFPLFVFIVGVSTVFSLTRAIEKDGPKCLNKFPLELVRTRR